MQCMESQKLIKFCLDLCFTFVNEVIKDKFMLRNVHLFS